MVGSQTQRIAAIIQLPKVTLVNATRAQGDQDSDDLLGDLGLLEPVLGEQRHGIVVTIGRQRREWVLGEERVEEPLGLDMLALLEAVQVVGGLDAVDGPVLALAHLGQHRAQLRLDLRVGAGRVALEGALAQRGGLHLVGLVHHAQRLELVVGAELLVDVAAQQLDQVLRAVLGEVRDTRVGIVAALAPGERLPEVRVLVLDVGRYVPHLVLKRLVLAFLDGVLGAGHLLAGAQAGDVLGGQEGGRGTQVERIRGQGGVDGSIGSLGHLVVHVAAHASAVLLVAAPVGLLAVCAAVAGELTAAAKEELHSCLVACVVGLLFADDTAGGRFYWYECRHRIDFPTENVGMDLNESAQ